MLRTGVDAQIAELLAAQRTARDHALDGLLHHALRETALQDRLRSALLDAADEAGVVVINLVLTLAAGQHDLGGIDDDDVVAIVDVRGIGGAMLAAQAHRNQGREPSDHQSLGVDQHPLLLDLGRFRRKRCHVR